MHATLPAAVIFDPADTRKLINPLFGLEPVEIAARAFNRGFDSAYHDHAPRVVPAWVPARFRGEYLKGWDTGLDARLTVEAEYDLANDNAVVSMPWGDESSPWDAAELAEAGVPYGCECRD